MKKIILFILLVLSVGINAQTTHTVINTNDSGLGSLRAAADSCVFGDTIRFNTNLITSGSDSIVLTTGEIAFGSKGIIIKGLYSNTDTLFISGNNNSRIFSFIGAGRVVLDSLALVNGFVLGSGGAVSRINCFDSLFVVNSILSGNVANNGLGGGIVSHSASPSVSAISSVIVSNSTISGNTARKGGGICLYAFSSLPLSAITSSFVSVENSLISGNTASNDGGGIYSGASSSNSCSTSVNILNSRISGNSANGVSGGGVYSRTYSSSNLSFSSVNVLNSSISGNSSALFGGGILSHSYSSSVFVSNSSIFGNSAPNDGGGVYSYSSSLSSVIVKQSTISGNSAKNGGGIYSRSYSSLSYLSSVSVSNSTISGNSATLDGGGIYSNSFSTSEITCTSSIISENGSVGSDIFNSQTNTITSGGYNLFSGLPNGTIGSDGTNITTMQLNLQPLSFNGGSTQTMLPGQGSIAINNGKPNDNSGAQNRPIVGVREIGAAENCRNYTIDDIVVCDSIVWIDGNTYAENNNTANFVLTNMFGCDSLVTLNLTVLATTYTDVIASCDALTWMDGITYNQSTNSPTYTIPNSKGCDSIIILDFTLLEADISVTRNYLTLTAQANNATFQWIDCNQGVIVGDTNASFTPTVNGRYKVEVSQNGCVDTSACFTIANVGIKNIELIGVSLYPNPTSDVLDIDKGNNSSLEITITNSAGAMVYQSISQNQVTTINMAKMATGMYIVILKNELGIKMEKVVKR